MGEAGDRDVSPDGPSGQDGREASREVPVPPECPTHFEPGHPTGGSGGPDANEFLEPFRRPSRGRQSEDGGGHATTEGAGAEPRKPHETDSPPVAPEAAASISAASTEPLRGDARTASAKLTYEDVAEACERVEGQLGEGTATTRSVHRLLGRGSFTTISGHIAEWKARGQKRDGLSSLVGEADLVPLVGAAKDLVARAVERDRAARRGEEEALRRSLDELDGEATAMLGQLSEAQAGLEASENARREIVAAHARSETALAEANWKVEGIARDLDLLRGEHEECLLGRHRAEAMAAEVGSALRAATEEAHALRASLETALDKAAAEQGRAEGLETRLAGQQADMEEVLLALTAAREAVSRLEGEGARLQASEREARAEIASLSAELRRMEGELAAARAETARIEGERVDLSNRLQEALTTRADLERETGELRTRAALAEAAARLAAASAADANASRAESEAARVAALERQAELTSSAKADALRSAALQAELDAARSKVEEEAAARREAERQLASARERIAGSEGSAAELRARAAETKTELAEASRGRARAEARLEAAEARAAGLAERVAALQNERAREVGLPDHERVVGNGAAQSTADVTSGPENA